MYVILILSTSLLLYGCAQRVDLNDPQSIASRVIIEEDNFKKVTSFTGPNCAPDYLADMLAIRAWKDRDGTFLYQIYVNDEYRYEIARGGNGWRFYSEAYDSDGNNLSAKPITRTVVWCGSYVCSYSESLGMIVTREYLEERKERGVYFKISGKRGEERFFIPATYVQAFLSKVTAPTPEEVWRAKSGSSPMNEYPRPTSCMGQGCTPTPAE